MKWKEKSKAQLKTVNANEILSFKAWRGDLVYNNTFKATNAKFKAFYYWLTANVEEVT